VAFFTSRDGVKLHYEVEGSGPPLIFHLGAGADIELWRRAGYVGPLSKAFTCVLFDHRGHGKSDRPSSPAANHIDRYADDLATLVEHLGYSSVSFFGWSNAFQVGLKAADQHPGMFDALVLFGAIPPYRTADELKAGTPERLAALRERRWRSLLDEMEAAEKFPVPQWFIESVEATDIEPYIAWTEARPYWDWSHWDAMPRVATPTLILAGELEDPDDLVGKAASMMPDATRVRIPDREHINAFLYSEFVVPRVLEFLAARSPQATG
jgi:pimeloyl-ACP methyl ester carboxylesterase